MKKKRLVGALVALLAIAVSGIGSFTPNAVADATLPFTQRYSTNANGAIISIGNQLLTCPDSDDRCAAALGGASYNNNAFVMTNLDVDTDPNTFNSSSSTLSLPQGAQVLWAGIYWGARLNAGSKGQAASGDRTVMWLKAPGTSSYQVVNSQAEFGPNSTSSNAYQEFADITQVVQVAGNGDYWGANVVAGTGEDRYAGWAITVVYQAPGMPLRNLTVFDGFEYINSGATKGVTVSGFVAPLAGTVDAQLNLLAWEGDFATSGDYTRLNSYQLATALSPGSNFFDSANGLNGVSVTTRNPAYRNMLGVDIKNLGISGAINNGDTSALFTFNSNGDVYFPGMLGLAINLYAPDFTSSSKSVVNLSGTGTAKPGDVLQYTLEYTNTGQDPAVNLLVKDVLPANVTYVPGSLVALSEPGLSAPYTVTDATDYDRGEFIPPGTGAPSGTVQMRIGCGSGWCGSPGSGFESSTILNVGDTSYFQFQVTVDNAAGGTTLTNIADLAYQTGTTGVSANYDTPPVSVNVSRIADVAITKNMTPNPAIAGQAGTTTLTVTNAGPNTATNVVVTDPVPSYYTPTAVNVTLTASGGSPTPGPACPVPATGAQVTCSLGDLPVGTTAVVTIAGQPDSATLDTSLSNIATVSTDAYDPVMTNNVASVSIPMSHQADLKIAKTTSTTTTAAGTLVTWTLTVTNQCPSSATGTCLSDAEGVVISDNVPDPSKLVLLSATGGTGAGGAQGTVPVSCPTSSFTAVSLQCTVNSADGTGRLTPGATAVVTVTSYIPANVAQGTAVSNSSGVTSTTFDPNQADNISTASVSVAAPSADIALTKTGPDTAVAGSTISYTITAVNNGPSDATGVVIADPQIPGLDFTNATVVADRGGCTSLPCTIGGLPGPNTPGGVGAKANVTIAGVRVDPSFTGTLANTATVSSTSTDPVSSNNTATANTTVTNQADLAITKTASFSKVPAPGTDQEVSYTITVTNNGPSAANGFSLTDTLPTTVLSYTHPDYSFTTGTGSCTFTDPTLSCSGSGSIPVGGTVVLQVNMYEADLYAVEPTSFVQTATVIDNVSGDTNDTATFTNSGEQQADLALTKTSAGDFIAGNDGSYGAFTQVSYTLNATNNGPDATTNPIFVDTLPPGVYYVSDSQNKCTVTSAGSLTNPEIITCDFTPAAGVTTVNPGASISDTIDVMLDPQLAAGEIINSATVMSDVTDPSEANNTAVHTDTVSVDADVEVDTFDISMCDTRVIGSDPCDSSYTGPGSLRTVYMHYVNNGPSAAKDVVIRSNVELTSQLTGDFPSWCHSVNQELVCDVDQSPDFQSLGGVLPPGSGLELGFTFTVAPSDSSGTLGPCTTPDPPAPWYTPPNYCNDFGGWAEITTSSPDDVLSNNGLTTQLAVGDPYTNLKISKTALSTVVDPSTSHDDYIAGAKFGYQIDVWVDGGDTGAADAANVVVTDSPVPAGFHVTQVNTPQGTCTVSGTGGETDNVVSCSLGTVPGQGANASPQKITITVYGTIDSDAAADGLVNQAEATSTTHNMSDEATDVTAEATVDVIDQADLQQMKTADAAVYYAGANVGYTLTTINNGPSDTDDAIVTDTLPIGLDLDTSKSPNCAVSSGDATTGEVVVCTIGAIAAHDSVNIRIEAKTDPRDLRPYWCPGQPGVEGVTCPEELPPTDLSGGKSASEPIPRPITNTAVASSSATDTNPDNNTATVESLLDRLADIAVTSSVSTDTPAAGTDITYTLTGVNNGPSTADSPVVDAEMPPGFIITNINVPTMSCSTSQVGNVQTLHCVGLKPTSYRDSFLPGFTIPGTVTVHIPQDTPAGQYTSTNHTYSLNPVECPDPGAGTCESDYTNNYAPATVNVVVVSDTKVVKTLVSPNPVVAGKPATYRLTATNAGPSVAHNVVISDTVPDGVTFESAQIEGGAACPAPSDHDQQRVVNCNAGSLAPGETKSALITFDLAKDYTGELCNGALVGSGGLDPNAADNDSKFCSTAVEPPETDVGITLTAKTKTVQVGKKATFTAVIKNNGPNATDDTVVTFELPDGFTDYSGVLVKSSTGTNPQAKCKVGSLICTIGDLGVGQSVTYEITGKVTKAAGKQLTLKGTVTHDDTDTNAANDTAKASVEVTATPSPSPSPSPGPLPYTGFDPLPLLAVAGILVIAGAFFLIRRKR
ncbi:MAG: DUF11 domain-containing protein [Propionibacteriaceae bacterium]|jgi:uncharacterized repeat protein (TIGR01451 family)|nr:DUF11 domain-containing protein [Propionibacteriaceae bacterium]